ncbi:MAG: hypothetical protein IAF94_10815 [Pirellulaceae bacterium]|nr:hypothetical protein [Pirellulaceae bacterium]
MALAVGCSSKTPTASSATPSAENAQYFLTAEPAAAKSVVDAKKSAQDGEEVTLVGRIGGSESPFVAGRASFTVVDLSLVPCSERPGDSCTTPWDYCCDTDALPASTAVVKIVDGEGKTIAKDARKELGMKELQTVTVKGKAKRDEAGNLVVLTSAVFVKNTTN